MTRINDLTGKKFGRLSVIERIDDYVASSGRRYVRWLCKCDCGKIVHVNSDPLIRGKTKSCGCLSSELKSQRAKTHGETDSRLYAIWCAIKARCLNSHTVAYKDYGARGITICDEWKDSYENFRDWANDNGYKKNLSIDRIDNDGIYEPSNCRWVTSVAQANNRRSNHILTYNGETHNVTEWAAIVGKDPKTIFSRLYAGWDVERALTA